MDIGLYETLTAAICQFKMNDIWTTMSLWNQIYIGLFGGNVKESTTDNSGQGEQRGNDWWGKPVLNSKSGRI